MPFEIVRNDICAMAVDAIVNTANPRPVIGLGVDSMLHEKAGPGLLEARKAIGHIAVGNAAVTDAYDLQAKYVIHTVGPVWRGGLFGESKQLRRCYDAALKLAWERGCRSVAFPLISSGNYGFPKDKALQIAIGAFSSFLLEHEMQIYLVVFDRCSFRLSEKLFHRVACYIDEHFVDTCQRALYAPTCGSVRRERYVRAETVEEECAPCAPMQMSLEDKLKQADAGFTETLLKLIDKTGKKDSQIYKKANISKQHFSKIRNDPDYKPKKSTAIALAIALELNLDATKDLIGRAGFALSNSSKFDLIIQYFIEQGNYNVVEINIALYEFDQPLLG